MYPRLLRGCNRETQKTSADQIEIQGAKKAPGCGLGCWVGEGQFENEGALDRPTPAMLLICLRCPDSRGGRLWRANAEYLKKYFATPWKICVARNREECDMS